MANRQAFRLAKHHTFIRRRDKERLDNKPYAAAVCCSRFSVLFAFCFLADY